MTFIGVTDMTRRSVMKASKEQFPSPTPVLMNTFTTTKI